MKKILITFYQIYQILTKNQKVIFVFVFIATSVGSLLECIGVAVIIPIINVLISPDQIMESSLVKENSFLSNSSPNMICSLIIFLVIIVYVTKNAYFIFLSWLRIKFSCKIQREISVQMMNSFMNRGYDFFLQHNYGQLSRGVIGDTNAINGVLNSAFRFFSDGITIILLSIFMMITDWQLSIAMVTVSIVCIYIIFFVFRKLMSKVGIELRKYTAKSSQAFLQAFHGIKDVLILQKQTYFIDEFKNNQIKVHHYQSIQTVGTESPTYIIEAICVSGLMSIVGAKLLSGSTNNEQLLQTIAAFAVAVFRLLPCLGRISTSINQILSTVPSVGAVYNNLMETGRYEKLQKEKYKKNEVEQKDQYTFNDKIELSHITFKYSKKQENVLDDLNLSIEKGCAVGFIGSSGAGKSTLADIILGLLIPQKGNIYIDGKNISENPQMRANMIGYVPQSVFLADTSIMQNIAFGESIDKINQELVWEVLEKAALADFIRTLPEGINTMVGERGVRLSGGQRQRIAIARALYYRPQILILDEATSALDGETESMVMEAIDLLYGHVTLLIIAHRVSTLKNCDLIYEINEGKAIERKYCEL